MQTDSRPLLAYFVLAYAASWAWTLPLVFAGSVIRLGRGWPTHFPALLGPLFAAFVLTAWWHGRTGIAELVTRMTRWRVGWQWWLWAVGSPLAFLAAGLWVARLIGAGPPHLSDIGRFNGLPDLGVLGLWAALIVVNGFGEETGWRGYALARLQRNLSPLAATMIVAVFWALWHFPFYFVVATYRGFATPRGVATFLIGITAGAVVLTWLYNRSGSSVLMVALWHGTFNLATGSAAARGAVAATVSSLVILQAIVLVALEARAGRRGLPSVIGPAVSPRSGSSAQEAASN